MTASEQRLKEALARAEAQLERQSGVDQAAWRTAEAEFNVRMASQRLQVARDVQQHSFCCGELISCWQVLIRVKRNCFGG